MLFPPQGPVSPALDLPSADTNLFERIIRNPFTSGGALRERECAEMLCAVLQNAGGLRAAIMAWLAGLAHGEALPLDDLEVSLGTEQSVYGKRDDLRITAQRRDAESDALDLLWTVEVKVGASFHTGSSLVDEVEEDVSQIANYDHWLTRQESARKAGFVLAKTDRTGGLPSPLANHWVCITWAQPSPAQTSSAGSTAFWAATCWASFAATSERRPPPWTTAWTSTIWRFCAPSRTTHSAQRRW